MFGSENTKQKTLLLLPAEAPTGPEASVAQHSPAEKQAMEWLDLYICRSNHFQIVYI